jgi:hypothetical protein
MSIVYTVLRREPRLDFQTAAAAGRNLFGPLGQCDQPVEVTLGAQGFVPDTLDVHRRHRYFSRCAGRCTHGSNDALSQCRILRRTRRGTPTSHVGPAPGAYQPHTVPPWSGGMGRSHGESCLHRFRARTGSRCFLRPKRIGLPCSLLWRNSKASKPGWKH